MSDAKQHRKELSYFNAIACLLVVLIHVLSHAISNADRTSWQAAAAYFPWRLSAFVVPGFLFTGAIKMSLGFDNAMGLRDYLRYVLGRFRRIWLPYALWHTVYFLVFLRIGFVSPTWDAFFRNLLLGGISSPFYYVIIVMQFYLLQPLWRWMAKQVPWSVSLTAAALITLCALRVNAFLRPLGITIPYTDRMLPTYLLFWVFGLYVGRHYDSFTAQLSRRKWTVALAALPVLALSFAAYYTYRTNSYLTDLDSLKVFADLLSCQLLLAVCIGLNNAAPRLQRALGWISRASFFIYLTHCLFLTLITNSLMAAGLRDITLLTAARMVCCYGCPMLLYAILDRFLRKCRTVLNGKNPPDT